jgi:hypothetical protein
MNERARESMTSSKGNDITPGGAGDMAVIGEGTPNQTSVSLQIIQNIYHELTRKTEDVSKSYNASFQIVHADFDQLHHRITQVCEQYNIKASNCSVKVYYINDTQETFSSFERFKHFNAGSSSSVESVLIKYNFLILLPKLNQPQSYTLSIRTASRVSIEKKMRDDMPLGIPKILLLMGNRTAIVTVKYVDYVVARNLLNIVDEWLNTLPKAKTPKLWDYMRKRSGYLPFITCYIVGIVVAALVLISLPHFVPHTATSQQLATFLFCSAIGLFTAYKLAYHLGSAAEDSLDRWNEISYVNLTAGDKKEIDDAQSKNKNSLLAAAIKFMGALSVSVLAKIIIGFIID